MRIWPVVFAFLALFSFTLPAFAEKRIALVIGNDVYRNLPEREQLHNAINDARAMRAALEGLGFEVMPVAENLDRAALVGRLSDFAAKLEQGDIAFFFYAGHGVSLNGANYLLPTDIPPPRASGRAEEDRLAELSVPESSISDRIKRSGARIAVVVLDACRDNPLAPPGGRSVGVSRGLAPPLETRGVLSIYSAGSGQQALDRLGETDTSANSVFTRVFVKKLKTPGLGLRAAAFETQGEVASLAGGAGHEQVPGVYSQIIGEDVFLAGREAVGPVAVEPVVADMQGAEFEAAMQADTVLALGAFAEKYKTGPFVVIARRERERLTKVAILEQAANGQAAKDAAIQAIRDQAARDAATQAIRDQAARDLAAKQAAESAQREQDRLAKLAALPPLNSKDETVAKKKAMQVATYGAWGAYVAQAGSSKTCYALSRPSERQPASQQRDPAYIFISTRPGEGIKNEVSINMGFRMKDDVASSANISGEAFDLIGRGNSAWIKNSAKERQFVDALRKGSGFVVKAPSVNGVLTTDSYSSNGLDQALNRVAKECQ